MKYIKENKSLFFKYLSVIISNILIYIFIGFYFKKMENNFLIMCLCALICDYVIFSYKNKVETNYLLDLLCNIFVGIILSFIIKVDLIYTIVLFSLFISNNIMFMKNKKDGKILKRMFYYFMILVITILAMFVSLALRLYL